MADADRRAIHVPRRRPSLRRAVRAAVAAAVLARHVCACRALSAVAVELDHELADVRGVRR